MNRNTLKYIAAAAMLLDHISAFFLPISTPLGCIMRIIGRLTAPIMCHFISEGFSHTASKRKYGIRLLVFAVISQLPYSLANIDYQFRLNMIFTLFLGFLMLCAYEKIRNNLLKTTVIILLFIIANFSEWGIIAPMWILSFYILRSDKKSTVTAFVLISSMHVLINSVSAVYAGFHWYAQLWQAGLLLFIPFFLSYNGKKGSGSAFSKWFFYIFYPLHLFIIALILNLT